MLSLGLGLSLSKLVGEAGETRIFENTLFRLSTTRTIDFAADALHGRCPAKEAYRWE